MSTPAQQHADFQVYPLRFSTDPAAMIAFLCEIGLAPVVTSAGDTFGELVAGGGGRVMVHAAAPTATDARAGETHLCFSVEAADPAAEALRRAGLEVRVWDETYGRQGSVRGPLGEDVSLNERQRDLYGYEGHDGEKADERVAVVAVRASAAGAQRDADTRFFGRFGLRPTGPGERSWQALTAPGAGVIGLHDPAGTGPALREREDVFGPAALVRLGLETSEELGDLAERLTAAGHAARVVVTDGGRSVHVQDPDGCHLEIHPRTSPDRAVSGG